MPLPSIPLDLPVQPEIPLAACRVLAAGLNHPEAVVVAPDGWLYAGGEAGEIYRVHARSGQFRTIARTGGFCLGLAFAGPRELIICDEGKHCIWRCDLAAKTPKLSRLASQVAGQNLRTPNYPALDPAGRLWVADSGDWDGNNGCLLCWDHSGTGTIVSRECAAFPNGLAFSLDGSWLYIVESTRPGISRLHLASGFWEPWVQFAGGVPDGCAMRGNGDLLVSFYAPALILSITPQREMRVLAYDARQSILGGPTNLALAGHSLYVANLHLQHLTEIPLPAEETALWQRKWLAAADDASMHNR